MAADLHSARVTMFYNPHMMDDAALRAVFVARARELDRLVGHVRAATPGATPKHTLVLGPRGMGKSTLLRRLALAVRDDPQLNAAWIPVSFPEEQYTVASLGDFWLNTLDALIDALERGGADAAWIASLDQSVRKIEGAAADAREEQALALIGELIAQQGRRILLLVDNSDMLFDSLGTVGGGKRDGGATPLWRLRNVLNNNPGVFWVGASYHLLEGDHLYNDAFQDFFAYIELNPLTVAELRDALTAMARTFGLGDVSPGDAAAQKITDALDAHPERLQILRHLSGGNPRAAAMLHQLFATDDAGGAHDDLAKLLDLMTPLYKARMEHLAEQPRKLLAHLMDAWAPQTVKQLSTLSQIPTTTLSGQMQRLEAEGLVEKIPVPDGGSATYQVSERLFNVWYLMRFCVRRQRQRLTWLVEFMRLWWTSEQLAEMAARSGDRLGRQGYRSRAELVHYCALADALPENHAQRQALRRAILDRVAPEDRDLIEDYLSAEPSTGALTPPADTASATAWLLYAFLLHSKEQRYDEAEDAYRRAIALEPKQARHYANLGNLLHRDLRRYDEAETAYRQACALDSTLAWSWNDLGDLLTDHLGRYDEAKDAYRQAIALDPTFAWPWVSLGHLLKNHLGRYDEAEDAYRRAIALDPKFALPWNNLGNLLQNYLGRYDEAEDAYRQAIALDPNYARPWNNLGNLLHDHLGRYDEAEDAYRRAATLDEENPYSPANLARLQVRRGDDADAIASYRRSTELCRGDEHAHIKLQAHLYLGNRDLAAQALTVLAEKAERNDKNAFFLLREQCWECQQIGRGVALAELMEASPQAGFLSPLSLALRAANGDRRSIALAPQEIREMAEEVLREIQDKAQPLVG